jgi:hypothetical protein
VKQRHICGAIDETQRSEVVLVDQFSLPLLGYRIGRIAFAVPSYADSSPVNAAPLALHNPSRLAAFMVEKPDPQLTLLGTTL